MDAAAAGMAYAAAAGAADAAAPGGADVQRLATTATVGGALAERYVKGSGGGGLSPNSGGWPPR